jgi:hypothetical protein
MLKSINAGSDFIWLQFTELITGGILYTEYGFNHRTKKYTRPSFYKPWGDFHAQKY